MGSRVSKHSLAAMLCGLMLGVSLLPSAPASAQVNFSVSGAVVNGSAGGAPVAQAVVTLEAVGSGTTNVVATASTDAAGRFAFDGMHGSPNATYLASVSFRGVSYRSASFTDSGDPAATANITAYENTEDASSVAVDRMSVVLSGIDKTRRLLTVVESYRFANAGLQSYVGQAVGGERESVRFALLGGAQSLVALQGFGEDDARAIPGGFVLSSPLVPGETTIAFTYDVPWTGRAVQLRRSLVYPTSAAQFVLADGIDAMSPQLPMRGSLTLGTRTFRTLESGALPAGSPVDITLTGLPAPSSTAANWDAIPLWSQILVLAAMCSCLAGSVAFARRRGAARSSLVRERARLLREVAQLDERAERGRMDSGDHSRRRAVQIVRIQAIDTLLREAPSRPEAPEVARPA